MNDKKIIDVTLTSHQDEKLKIILEEILIKYRKRVLLTGSAGVGKTTLVNFLLETFINEVNSGIIYIAAPTHKALSVLKTKIAMEEEHDPVTFCTIHKGLKLKMQINKRTGSKHFVQKFSKKDPPFRGCKLLIIDEASMLTEEQLSSL